MTSQPNASRPLLRLGAVCACSLVALSSGWAQAWPRMPALDPPSNSLPLVQAEGESTPPELEPFAELNEVLETARVKLEQQLDKIADAQRNAAQQLDRMNSRVQEREQRLEAMAKRNAAAVAAVDRAEAETARLRKQLETTEERLAGVIEARAEAEAKIGNMETVVESALGEAASLGRQLSEVKQAEADARVALDRIESERDAARRQLASERTRRQEIQQELAELQDGFEERNRENEELREQIAALQNAADEARQTAQQNLEAVEEKIRILNEALAEMRPDENDEVDEPAPAQDAQPRSGEPRYPIPNAPSSDASPPGADPEAVATAENGEPAARSAVSTSELAAVRSANATESRELAAFNGRGPERSDDAPTGSSSGTELEEADATGGAAEDAGPTITVAEATSRLPMEKRLQAQSLLADLRAEKRSDGLVMRVPGEELFSLDSEVIEPTAHDTLAKVAELISMFEDRDIQIIGHTDAMGDADYNQALSERRADLVRKFFVENYELADARLDVVGAGERRPIATNSTRSGRRANRRIEVVIED